MDEGGGDRLPRAEAHYAGAHSAANPSPSHKDRVGVWRRLEHHLGVNDEGCGARLAAIDARGIAANRPGAAPVFIDDQLNPFVRSTANQPSATRG